jgi:hypothetical protein
MVPWCEAYVPVVGQLQPCKAPAVVAYRYRCRLGHDLTRSVCAGHDPVPGEVGCYHCRQAGIEEPMTWQLTEVAGDDAVQPS